MKKQVICQAFFEVFRTEQRNENEMGVYSISFIACERVRIVATWLGVQMRQILYKMALKLILLWLVHDDYLLIIYWIFTEYFVVSRLREHIF